MKKLIVLIMAFLLLAGCNMTDAQRFEKEYGVSGQDRAVYLKESSDLEYQLNNGTHVILVGGSSKDKSFITILVEEVKKQSGLSLYYRTAGSFNNTDKSTVGEALKQLGINDYELPLAIFIKTGEVIEAFTSSEGTRENVEKTIQSMVKEFDPGCDGC